MIRHLTFSKISKSSKRISKKKKNYGNLLNIIEFKIRCINKLTANCADVLKWIGLYDIDVVIITVKRKINTKKRS